MSPDNPSKLRVCAVSYLNTVPLVWGMLHGPQLSLFDLDFRLPSECAERLRQGQADIGIAPSIELARQGLDMVPGLCIASRGAVRSILLISKVPLEKVSSLALDTSSRTSVILAQILLRHRYGVQPRLLSMAPDLQVMMAAADACVIIGDPALRLDPAALPWRALDLGQEWFDWTGLPMVFAAWGAHRGVVTPEVARSFAESCRYGLDHIEDIVPPEASARGLSEALTREYLARQMVFSLGPEEQAGLERFLTLAGQSAKLVSSGVVS